MTEQWKELTVIIPTVGRQKPLMSALCSILGQEQKPGKVLVGVDHNEPFFRELQIDPYFQTIVAGLEALGIGFQMIENKFDERGMCSMTNTLMEKVSTRYVSRIDDDSFLPSNWFQKLRVPLEVEAKRYMAISGIQVLATNDQEPEFYEKQSYDILYGEPPDIVNRIGWVDDGIVSLSKEQFQRWRMRKVCQAEMLYHTWIVTMNTVHAVGGFDMNIRPPGYYDEVSFFLAAKEKMGISLRLVTGVEMYHFRTVDACRDQMDERMAADRNRAYVSRKYEKLIRSYHSQGGWEL